MTKLRPHTKLLIGDYLTYQIKFDQTGQGNPICKLCRSENKTICHIISMCPIFIETRSRILQEMSDVCKSSRSNINFQLIVNNPISLRQFILDPTSFNLIEIFVQLEQKLNTIIGLQTTHHITTNYKRSRKDS